MMNRKILVLFVILLLTLSACSSSNDVSSNNQHEKVQPSESTELPKSHESSTESNEDNIAVSVTTTETTNKKQDDKEEVTVQVVTKVEGRKTEFLERLDNIQKELDALPEKKDADKGVTNAMKSYYGTSYERYDKELNEIYALLKKELSPETFEDLKAKQLKWIEEKEKKAEEERLKYEGATFEYVAFYISLYESTKDKCYELVNTYMTD